MSKCLLVRMLTVTGCSALERMTSTVRYRSGCALVDHHARAATATTSRTTTNCTTSSPTPSIIVIVRHLGNIHISMQCYTGHICYFFPLDINLRTTKQTFLFLIFTEHNIRPNVILVFGCSTKIKRC